MRGGSERSDRGRKGEEKRRSGRERENWPFLSPLGYRRGVVSFRFRVSSGIPPCIPSLPVFFSRCPYAVSGKAIESFVSFVERSDHGFFLFSFRAMRRVQRSVAQIFFLESGDYCLQGFGCRFSRVFQDHEEFVTKTNKIARNLLQAFKLYQEACFLMPSGIKSGFLCLQDP